MMNKGHKIITGLIIGMSVTSCVFAAKKLYEVGTALYRKRQIESVDISELVDEE